MLPKFHAFFRETFHFLSIWNYQGSTPLGNFLAGSVMKIAGVSFGFFFCGASTLLLLAPILLWKRKTVAAWLKQ